MGKSSLKQNFIFQGVYQVLIYVIPLIIAPYLTRTLRADALGTYSYVNSLAYYFIIFANLGISRHGQRSIAASKNNETKCRKVFWSLMINHFVISISVVILYFIFSIYIVEENRIIYLIESFYVISAVFDVTWFFYGMENFKNVVIRNTIVKLIECIAIFLFVKNPEDLYIYTFIMSGSIITGQLIIFFQAITQMPYIKVNKDDLKEHIKPLLILFIAVIASTLYTVFDKTLIGMLLNKRSVAFYEYGDKIINIPKCLMAVVGTVMFPRACKAVADKKYNLQKKYIDFSLFIIVVMSVGCMFGLMAISNKLTILYFGNEFSITGSVIKAMTPLLLIILCGDVLRSEYLIPLGKDVWYVTGIFISAIINIVISFILIPKIGIFGAIVGTISAELFNLIFEIVLCRKILDFLKILKIFIPTITAGVIMFEVVSYVDAITLTTWKFLMLEIIVGVIIYCVIIFILLFTIYREYRRRLLKEFIGEKNG